MEKKYLIINRGSASEKMGIYTKDSRLVFLHLEKSEDGLDFVSTLFLTGSKEEKKITQEEYENSLAYGLDLFTKLGIISGKADIAAIGVRIVAPGEFFQADKIIDKNYISEVKKVLREAPLHILPTYEAIKNLKKIFKKTPIVGVSDSDFHKTIPTYAKYYGLPHEITKKYQIARYGYHGVSVESIVNRMKDEGAHIPSKMIICHIGSGVSITAVKDGKSIENSMGFTPLEGVMMATRAGNIDPGTVAFVSDKLKLKGNKLKDYLNKTCGLLGVSGTSSDVRELLILEKQGDVQAKLALDMYVYNLQKCIGSYFAAMGGMDTIIFSATVGERSFVIRERVCEGLGALGIKIDQNINNQSVGIDADITAAESKVKILVRKTDEMKQIARDTISTLGF